MREINLLVVHCSASRAKQDIGLKEVDEMHRKRGFRKVGYHYVIRRDGKIEKGRPHAEIGAHVQSHNANSIGCCMVGGLNNDTGKAEDNFTPEQYKSLRWLLGSLLVDYPLADVVGHRDLSPDLDGDGIVERHEWLKECPCFDVRKWWQRGY